MPKLNPALGERPVLRGWQSGLMHRSLNPSNCLEVSDLSRNRCEQKRCFAHRFQFLSANIVSMDRITEIGNRQHRDFERGSGWPVLNFKQKRELEELAVGIQNGRSKRSFRETQRTRGTGKFGLPSQTKNPDLSRN
jgi:hypothetical protein